MTSREDAWPSLPLESWSETCATLHMWAQIVGKIRLVQSPWLNHSWHVTLYVTASGLSTTVISSGGRDFQIEFDFIDHILWIRTSEGHFGLTAFGLTMTCVGGRTASLTCHTSLATTCS